ncbi:Hypothetical protein PHPALM_18248 [Phytophthora palmivora]|uniref:Uncharacterized protein n=1 Tax=Phytophthora palmivora TaxID=4796 RepID=A0A2P4XK85_9STRA|nr:Hypothetical protein PHPALM_18248 [Phytophthora palmivora]
MCKSRVYAPLHEKYQFAGAHASVPVHRLVNVGPLCKLVTARPRLHGVHLAQLRTGTGSCRTRKLTRSWTSSDTYWSMREEGL